jgi:Mg-chelatase subunit ChlD
MLHFTHPLFFLLLIFLPLFLVIHRRTRVESARWRRLGALSLRSAAVLCLMLALAGLQWKSQENMLSVLFALDISESVPVSQQEQAIAQINTAVDALKPTDQFGVVLLAEQAALRVPMRSKMEQPRLTPELLADAALNRQATNLSDAIQLALSHPAQRKRIVLLSDGIQNVGEVAPLLDLLRTSGIEVFTIPLNPERKNEVWARELQTPPQARAGVYFDVRAIVEATSKSQATLKFYRNDVPVDMQQVNLESGRQIVAFQQRLSDVGNYAYRLEIVPTADEMIENNVAYGFTRVSGNPHVLYVEGDIEQAEPLKTVLENNLLVKVISPAAFPTNLAAMQESDVLILSNVSADDLSVSQMAAIESYVRDLGKGLVVIGGDHAFGKGGYHDTPLERTLPVEMTPRRRKQSLALMFVVDASGSMANYVGADQKIQLAIEGVRAAVRALDDEDLAGVIGFATKIQLEVSPTTAHESIVQKVGQLRPGGGTRMYPALKRAYEHLKETEAKQKHIIVLSDGKSDGDFETLAKQIAADNIRITTIAIGDAAQELMQKIAELWGKGVYHYVGNLSQLPRILAEEARQTQPYMIQEEFQPVISQQESSILSGISRVPKLYGYIAASEKETAQVYLRSHQEDPILAAWSYGLGRAVAFTSDAKPGWAADWIAWEGFGRFWGQVVNWASPQPDGNADFDLRISNRHGKGEVVIETESILPASALFNVRVARPAGEGEAVELRRVAPTRYTGEFQVQAPGVYFVVAQQKRNDAIEASVNRQLVVSYPQELAEFEMNAQLLNEIANRTNGVFNPSPEQVSSRSGKGVEQFKPLVFALLIASVVLFTLEMLIRRFSISSRYITDLKAQLRALHRREAIAASPSLARLRQRKAVMTNKPVTSTGSLDRRRAASPQRPPATTDAVSRLLQAKRRTQSLRSE